MGKESSAHIIAKMALNDAKEENNQLVELLGRLVIEDPYAVVDNSMITSCVFCHAEMKNEEHFEDCAWEKARKFLADK